MRLSDKVGGCGGLTRAERDTLAVARAVLYLSNVDNSGPYYLDRIEEDSDRVRLLSGDAAIGSLKLRLERQLLAHQPRGSIRYLDVTGSGVLWMSFDKCGDLESVHG